MSESHLAHIAQLEAKFGADSEEVATALNTLAFRLCEWGKSADAGPYFGRSLAIREALYGPASLLPQLDAWIDQKHAVKFRHLEPFLLRRLAIKAATWGEVDSRVAEECDRLASRYLYRNEPERATQFLERSLAIKTELNGADSKAVAHTLQMLADACLRDGERELAGRYRERCIAVTERVHGADSKEVAVTLVMLALAIIAANKEADQDSAKRRMRRDALAMVERAVSIEEALFGADSLQVQKMLEAVVRGYLDCRDFGNARPLLERLRDICERAYGADAPALLWILATLAQIYAYDGSQRAEPTLERCFPILRAFLDVKRPTAAFWIEQLPKDRQALYCKTEAGVLETLVTASERVHYNTMKRWGWG